MERPDLAVFPVPDSPPSHGEQSGLVGERSLDPNPSFSLSFAATAWDVAARALAGPRPNEKVRGFYARTAR